MQPHQQWEVTEIWSIQCHGKKESHQSLLDNLLCYKTFISKDLDAFYPTELKKRNCSFNKSVNKFLKRELIISKQSETLIFFQTGLKIKMASLKLTCYSMWPLHCSLIISRHLRLDFYLQEQHMTPFRLTDICYWFGYRMISEQDSTDMLKSNMNSCVEISDTLSNEFQVFGPWETKCEEISVLHYPKDGKH